MSFAAHHGREPTTLQATSARLRSPAWRSLPGTRRKIVRERRHALAVEL
jgi:hypothetical protein